MLMTITFQERCRKTIWTRFLTIRTIQNNIRDFMTLDTDKTSAESGTPLDKQILAMQRGRCHSSLPVLRSILNLLCHVRRVIDEVAIVGIPQLIHGKRHPLFESFKGLQCRFTLSVSSEPSAGSDRISGLARSSKEWLTSTKRREGRIHTRRAQPREGRAKHQPRERKARGKIEKLNRRK